MYRQSWDELVASREWTQFSPSGHAVLGIDGDDHELGCRIKKVVAGYPAAEAKLQVDDVIVQFDGKTFDRFDTLRQLIASKKPGDSVELEIRRGAETIVTSIVLGKRRASW